MRPIQVTRRFPSNSWPMILVFLRVIYHSRKTSRLLTTIFSATMKQRRARRDESVPLERLVTTAWITISFFWKLVAESRDTRRISIVLFSVPIVCRFYLEFATQAQLRHATFVFHPRRASPKEERLLDSFIEIFFVAQLFQSYCLRCKSSWFLEYQRFHETRIYISIRSEYYQGNQVYTLFYLGTFPTFWFR